MVQIITDSAADLQPIPYEEYQNLKPAELAALVKERIAAKIRECTQEG